MNIPKKKILPKENKFNLYTTFEPKVKSRFISHFKDSTGIFLPTFVVYGIERPKCQIIWDKNEKPKICWLPISVELYDPIVPSTAQALISHLKREESFNLVISVLGPTGDEVENWEITNAKIIFIDFGSLNWHGGDVKSTIESINTKQYVNGDILRVFIKIEYDCAILKF